MNKKERLDLRNRRIVATRRIQQELATIKGYVDELMQIELELAGEEE